MKDTTGLVVPEACNDVSSLERASLFGGAVIARTVSEGSKSKHCFRRQQKQALCWAVRDEHG